MSGAPSIYRMNDMQIRYGMSFGTGAPAQYASFKPVPSGLDIFYAPPGLAGDIKKPEPKQEPKPEPAPVDDGKFLRADGVWVNAPDPKPEPIPEPVGPSRAQLRRERLTAELRTALDRNTK